MITLDSRKLWSLALGLALTAWAARDAKAASMTSFNYGTIGTVNTPTGATPNQIFFSGTTGTVTQDGSINLGSFVVAKTASPSSLASFDKDPFSIVVYSGGDQSAQVSGILNVTPGTGGANPTLTATIQSVNPFGNSALPFNLQVPLNTPLPVALSSASAPASTLLTGAASGVPEPASVAVFAVMLGGLGVWNRRRAAR